MSVVPTPSPYGFTRILMPCAAGRQQQQWQWFSPNCVPFTNTLSPLWSIPHGTSPEDSTTLSPLQAPSGWMHNRLHPQQEPPPHSQQAAVQVIANSNVYSHASGVGGLGNVLPFREGYQNDDYSVRLQQLHRLPHQHVSPADEMLPIHTQVRFMNNYNSSP